MRTLHAGFLIPLALVLGMLIRGCHIVTQSSFPRSYQGPVCYLPSSSVSIDPRHPICAPRGVTSDTLRLGD
ncbi:unnamed protein product [Protopolystoma xenopodis]|uniref:Uncharacterized protein n=1 Tax=Protopolystoma xenopodis TaxID=117903 RepID=A0A3S5CF72_9PLAT|nr:unnamed protein product [Protopolystoma xenopodis]